VTTTAAELAAKVTQLASFPEVAFRINDAILDEHSGAAEIGALIEPDPALSAALLRIANSAHYRAGGEVGSVERAVAVVGLREIRDLTFSICASKTFDGIPNELVSVKDFWKHSLYCATGAQSIARKAKVCQGESLFAAGLLHDIGHLVMFSQSPDLSRQALQLSLEESDGLSPYLSERTVFGFDHMAVGVELARQWRLPTLLRECMEYHHEPLASDAMTDAVLVVHAANSIAVMAELDSLDPEDAPPIDDRVFTRLGLDADSVAAVVEETREAVAELLNIFVN